MVTPRYETESTYNLIMMIGARDNKIDQLESELKYIKTHLTKLYDHELDILTKMNEELKIENDHLNLKIDKLSRDVYDITRMKIS